MLNDQEHSAHRFVVWRSELSRRYDDGLGLIIEEPEKRRRARLQGLPVGHGPIVAHLDKAPGQRMGRRILDSKRGRYEFSVVREDRRVELIRLHITEAWDMPHRVKCFQCGVIQWIEDRLTP